MKNVNEKVINLLDGIEKDKRALQMKNFIQHGKISTYDHCMNVARMSYRINSFFRLKSDVKRLIIGAFLHDYFLYDWHKKSIKVHNLKEFFNLHGFTHPGIAAKNAIRDFNIDEKEADIIKSHMWPLTLKTPPKTREAVIVCIADKIVSLAETVFRF